MRTKILPLFLCYFLQLASLSVHAQGGTLPLNSSVNGNLTSTTPDVWDITITADGLLRLTFSGVSPADLYVSLYDNDGTTPIGNQLESYNNSVVILTADGLAAGNYHIKITPYASTTYGAYTLADSFFVSALANDTEPNGSIATALVLPQNSSKTGHVGYYYNTVRDTADWYKVTTSADGLLRVSLSTERTVAASTNPLDVNVTLYDTNRTTPLGAIEVFNANGPATGVITADGLAPGTYYVKVQPYSTTEFADYTISDSLFVTALANDAEPNGTRETALVLPQNSSATGHLGYHYNNQLDTADWYQITTAADGLLRVYLTTARGSIYSNNSLDVNLTLYDNNGTTPLGAIEVFNANNPATGVITADGLAPGTYYVKVQPYSTTEFANYTISDSLFVPALANDSELNGTRTTAVLLPPNGSTTGHVGYYYNNQRDTTDWYKITTTADGLLRVYLTSARGSVYSNNNLDVNVTLYDNDGTTPLGAIEVFNANNPATNLITADGLAPGTYYVKVQPYATSQFTDYILSDSLFLTPVANDTEPNGTSATASDFALNYSTTGHSGYKYNNQRDTSDWYKITTIAEGPLHVYLSSLRGSIYSNNPLDMVLTFYGSDGTTQLGSREIFNGNEPATDSLTFASLAAGTYFIKITNYSTVEFANYVLSNSVAGGILPVSFISFDGTLANGKALLTWSTASEINNKGFEIEKSKDGQSFTGIGFVPGTGNSAGVNTYHYTDNAVASGYNYYRLKQTNLDGSFKYSSIIQLDFSQLKWTIFGNPVSSNTWIELQLDRKAKVTLQVLATDGKLVETIDKGSIAQGTYSIPLPLLNAPPGIYMISLLVDNHRYSKTIIKQ